MKHIARKLAGIFSLLAMIFLIFDTKNAVKGASEGITLCLSSIVPTLFPFCVITKMLGNAIIGRQFPILSPLGRACGIPKGAESVFLLGFLGGYPVGAQVISDACKSGAISVSDGRRMLGFCSNAGPAFLFGILGGLFSNEKTLWAIFIIQIISALIVGMILPGKSKSERVFLKRQSISFVQIVKESIITISQVCGWVILFRIIISFLKRWFLWLLPSNISIAVIGTLELANGCIELYNISTHGIRYILSGVLLSFGGICVMMQTLSVTQAIGHGMYLVGKILQAAISFLLCALSQYLLFSDDMYYNVPMMLYILILSIIAAMILYVYNRKKVVAFMLKMLYNKKKDEGDPAYAVSQENAA